MKSFSIIGLRSNAKIVPLRSQEVLKQSFVREVKRRLREEKSLPAEKILKQLW